MYCKHCGQPIDDDSTFCKHCGKSQETVVATSDVKQKPSDVSSSVKVEIIKPQRIDEEKLKRNIISVIKELGIIALFIGIAFGCKALVFYAINSTPYPVITKAQQEAFNDAIFKKEWPNGVPSLDELKDGWDREKYPHNESFSFGLELSIIGYGDYKYDSEATSMNDYKHFNDFRKYRLQAHAEKAAEYTFWILLIGLPIIRYLYFFIKWLRGAKS